MQKRLRILLLMDEHVCPWWLAYSFDNRLRLLFHNPEKLFGGYVKPGDTVVDIGSGMGFFSIAMARMVGEAGNVIAVDIQSKMLSVLRERAEKQGVEPRIRLHQCRENSLGLTEPVDFALAFWMVHEVPDPENLMRSVRSILKPGALFFYAEPRIHVSRSRFEHNVETAQSAGLKPVSRPPVSLSRAVVFKP